LFNVDLKSRHLTLLARVDLTGQERLHFWHDWIPLYSHFSLHSLGFVMKYISVVGVKIRQN